MLLNISLAEIVKFVRNYFGPVATALHPTIEDLPEKKQEKRAVALRCEDHKLIIRVINFELVQPLRPRYLSVTDRHCQADGP